MDKVLSGRWILTVTCALVFAYVAMNGMLPKEAVASILTMVFVSYFNRKQEDEVKK